MTDTRDLALNARAWPFEEARKLLERTGGTAPEKGYVLFETGYGPSGLPHIGTFGEVARTSMVRHAFAAMSDIPTRLFAFSDDMDGLRKVPDNVPNQDMLAQHLHKPLTRVPDPFGTHESFGHHNNARLRALLDEFGFDYEFKSATECYASGEFDAALLAVLQHYEAVRNAVLPTLGAERRATYSPFLPVCRKTGHVLQVPVDEVRPQDGMIVYTDPNDGERMETLVTGGACKLQWKADWAMRWHALGVDYEMSGKDLIDSVKLSSKICRILGSRPPEGFNYELFLDEKGEKISKSKGNGLSVEEWLAYAPPDSLALFMYQKPRAAKRLYFDVIPRAVDDWLTFLGKYEVEDEAKRLENPAWHIHSGAPPREEAHLSFNILLNLAGVVNADDKAVLWGFITRYAPKASPRTDPILDSLAGYAIRYYQDFVKPSKKYRAPDATERAALDDLVVELEKLPKDASAEDIQTQVYEVGKRHDFESLRHWFKACYEVLLGQDQGPRLGSFIALYGIDETIALIRRALAGEDLAASGSAGATSSS
ncbi:MAG: lysine--tRNA ligase [Rhodospirillales bacterium]|nr:MAG: lysine--tRNA ligase [Rhodospirillales bacterium]